MKKSSSQPMRPARKQKMKAHLLPKKEGEKALQEFTITDSRFARQVGVNRFGNRVSEQQDALCSSHPWRLPCRTRLERLQGGRDFAQPAGLDRQAARHAFSCGTCRRKFACQEYARMVSASHASPSVDRCALASGCTPFCRMAGKGHERTGRTPASRWPAAFITRPGPRRICCQ